MAGRDDISGLSVAQIKAQIELLGLSDAEKQILDKMVKETQTSGYSPTFRSLEKVDWKWTPVSGSQFIQDPYYLGTVYDTLYPGVRKDFISIIDRPIPVLELILKGSLRWGKSYLAALVSSYHIYRLSCMANPQKFLGLSPVSSIYFLNLSVTGYQASEGIFSDVKSMVDSSPYFQEKFLRNPRQNSSLCFPNNIVFKSGSSSEFSAIGKNVYVGIVDESNFFGVKKGSSKAVDGSGEYDAAKTLYEALVKRIRSTYTSHGITQGLGILSSSARYPQDFVERKIEFLEKLREEGQFDGTVAVKDHSVWEVRDVSVYTKPKFQVEVGDSTRKSRILPPNTPASEIHGRVIDVPGEFRTFFMEDIELAIRDLAGISTISISSFFQRREKVTASFVVDHPTYRHPFDVDVTFSLRNPLVLDRLVKMDALGRYRPIYNPGAPRGIHLDLSKAGTSRDPTGFAMGHVSGYRKIQVIDPETLKSEDILRPIIRMDIVCRVSHAETEEELDHEAVIRFIIKLRILGFNIAWVTADQYQSASILQALKRKGIKTFVKSSRARNFTPYIHWKDAVYEDRFQCYQYEPLRDEMVALQDTAGTVDHPPGGHNDVCDSVACVVDELHEQFFQSDSRSLPVSGELEAGELEAGDVVSVDKAVFDGSLLPVMTDIPEHLAHSVAAFVLQRTPLEWESYSPDEAGVVLYLLRQKAVELTEKSRYPQAQLCLNEIERRKEDMAAIRTSLQ